MSQNKLPQEEVVIKHIKELLYSGELCPGDRLPAERKLAEHLSITRIHVRSALQKLEFHGIVKTFPQSGSIISKLKVQALEQLITDVLKIEQYDFFSLVEVRIMLEAQAIRLCAERRTEEDLEVIEKALVQWEEFYHDTKLRVDNDFILHQTIAQGSQNPVVASMLLIITPDIMKYYRKYNACSVADEIVKMEHREIFRCIKEQDIEGAEKILIDHLSNIKNFAFTNNSKNHYLNTSHQMPQMQPSSVTKQQKEANTALDRASGTDTQ